MNSGGGGGGGRDDGSEGSGGGAGSGGAATGLIGMMNSNNSRSLFTVSQWQELEHQALIFKYMMAGLPVPPELVLPIQKSLDSISQRFFHHPTMGYCSLYGKKVDPEPGRCRRTDGKKWRCSKDAYPDSKYCERHMHRGRNRSRKPVESQQQQSTILTESSSSAVTSSLTGARTGSGAVSFQNLPLATAAVLSNSDSQRAVSGTSQSHYQLDSIPYAIPNKDYRYLQGMKPDMGEHSFFSEPSSGSNRAHQVDTSLDNAWSLMPSGVPPVSALKLSENSMIASEYPLNSFFTTEYNSPSGGEPVKQEGQGQSLRPFFDEWPRTRESWSGLEDKRSNQTSFSTTQLSISIPMASSEFNAPTSRSPHDH